MRLALAAVPTGREPVAWTLTQLGKLRFGAGDVAGAARPSNGVRFACCLDT